MWALYFLIIAAEPAVIRASLAALFFFTDFYALFLAYFNDILNQTVLYRTLPLVFIVPIGVFFGRKPIKGSCGGMGKVMGKECAFCKDPENCKKRPPK